MHFDLVISVCAVFWLNFAHSILCACFGEFEKLPSRCYILDCLRFPCFVFSLRLVMVVVCYFVWALGSSWPFFFTAHGVTLILWPHKFLGLYHIVFQLLGDWWMLVGLLVLAFSPMIYLAFGMYYRITRHMTDNSISRAMQSINIASSVVAVIGNSAEVVHVWISRSEILLPTIFWNQELFADHRPLQSALACFMSSSDRAKMLEENRHSTVP